MNTQYQNVHQFLKDILNILSTDRPKSVRNRCLIELFVALFVLSLCLFDISVCVGAFVIGLSQVSSFLSSKRISGDFINTKDRHYIGFISFNMKCPNVYTHAHFSTIVK